MALSSIISGIKAIKGAKPAFRYARRFVKACLGKDHLIPVDVRIPKLRLGNDWADWVVVPHLLERGKPIVYSVGLGSDISFDLAMIDRFGCDIFGFDPTPISQDYLNSIALPAAMHVYPFGLATFDGTKTLGVPSEGDVSFSSVTGGGLNLEVRKISSLMAMLGHDHIDLLKMDIEGDEYDCVRQLLDEKIFPAQLLVEFHHGYYDIEVGRTRRAIDGLHEAGYKIFDISPLGREISFIHSSALADAKTSP